MKKLLVVILFIMSSSYGIAQHTADIGVQLGAATYWGSFNRVNYAKSITPEAGILGRWNFNKRLAVRGQIVVGRLAANGLNPYSFPNPNDPITFNRLSFQTVETMLEFNFRNYRLGRMKSETFTPFLAMGIGWFYSTKEAGSVGAPTYTVNTPVIPVGAGFKFNITKRLGGLAEVVVRKAFTYKIDNLLPPSPPKVPINKTDWYATVDVSLTWQLWSDQARCALYDKIRKTR